MMKRSYGVNCFISAILGGAVGTWMYLAVSQSSIFYGVLAILAVIALVLNCICGADRKGNSKTDKE